MLFFADALQALADALELPALTPQQDGLCHLVIKDLRVSVAHYPSLNGLALRVRVGNIANDGFAHWLETLSGANLFGDGPTGSVLGVEPDASVFLTQFIPSRGISPEAFLRIFRGFIERAHHWAVRLADTPVHPLPSAPESLALERLS